MATDTSGDWAKGAPMPMGFNSGTLDEYYKSLTQPIDERTEAGVGMAQSEALARGLEGTPTETGGVAAARHFGSMEKTNALGALKFNLAGMTNQDERLKQQQAWQGKQNLYNRFQQLQMDQEWGDRQNTLNRHGYQNAIATGGISEIGNIIGGV